MSKKLLIISHAFPPNPGIGGRRWAKFAKYLSRKGFQIQVLASENVSGVQSEWNEDIRGINVKYLPYKFPKIVSYPGRTLVDRIYYRLMVYLLKLRDNGNYFDRTTFWKHQVQEEIAYYIEKEHYNCVIVTAGPFKLSHYIAEMKQKFPTVKFIVDFRDLWTEDFEITSFSGLSFHRKLKEKKIEKETVHYADKVITVAPKLNEYFGSLTIKNKTEVIPNGFDPEDFKEQTGKDCTREDGMIRFVFTGTLYINLDYILKPFFEGLAALRSSDPELYRRISIEFIGNFPATYLRYITENKLDIVSVTSKLPLNEVYRKINESSYCLLFLNDIYNFALSTKFCEYISQKRKIVVVSNYGPAAKFIQKNQLGFWIDPSKSHEELRKLIESSLHGNALQWNTTFDINEFSLASLTDKLIGIIESDNYPKTCTVNQKHLLLTFDYELYLGSLSGTVENCLIRPTSEILSILKEVGIRNAVFFVDTSYLIRIKANKNCVEDYKKLREQLIGILKEGHFIFPHIHPHWSDAVYDEQKNQWILNDLSKYRFHNISFADQVFYFEESIRLIQELQAAAGVNYAIDSYRAGGWCLQPFDKFMPFFKKHGIRYDFSVLKGFRKITNDVYYDYTKVSPKPVYKFSESVDVEDKNGSFTELSISSINISYQSPFLNKVFNKYLWVTKNRSMGDGVSIKQTEEAFIREIEMHQHEEHIQNIEMASLELLTFYKMNIYKDFLGQND
ncbi:MAG: hypothetical protein ACXVPD_03270, partial [Bacteroidia bacterium]